MAKSEKKNVTLSLSLESVERLERICEKENRSRSAQFAHMIDEMFSQMES